MKKNSNLKSTIKFGIYSSISLSILTIITFGFAMTAVPPAGPYCPGNCMSYPYPDILLYYPRDYYWMYLAIFQLFAYIIFIFTNHFLSAVEKKLYGFISCAFALISTAVLLIAYYTQFSIIPVSLMKGETEGIALFTQYNGHGIFIALEELGFITMSISFLFHSFIFSMKNRLEKSMRLLLMLPFLITIFSFILYSFQFGIDRDYRFEVATLSINWLVIIVIGILNSIYLKRIINSNSNIAEV